MGSSSGCPAQTPTCPPPTASGWPCSTPRSTTGCWCPCWAPTTRQRRPRSATPYAWSTRPWLTPSPAHAWEPPHETCHNVSSPAPQEELGEALDERERLVGDLTPAAVDGQRVSPAGDLLDLGHAGVVLLLLVGGVDDRRRDGVIQLAGEEQQRPPVGVLGVDLVLGPGIQVGRRGLPQRLAGGRHRELLIQLLGLLLADGVGEAVAELLEGERHRPVTVGRVAQHR